MRAISRQRQRGSGWRSATNANRAEQTTLYCLVQQHAAGFIVHIKAGIGAELPWSSKDEFDAFLEGAPRQCVVQVL